MKVYLLTLTFDSVDALLELFTYLKEGKLLRWNRNLLASFRVTALVRPVLLYNEASETSDLDSATTNERVTHLAVHEVNYLLSLNDIYSTALCQLLDEF